MRDRRPVSHEVTAPPRAPEPIKICGPHGTCMWCGGDFAVRFRGDHPARCLGCGRPEPRRDCGESLDAEIGDAS